MHGHMCACVSEICMCLCVCVYVCTGPCVHRHMWHMSVCVPV